MFSKLWNIIAKTLTTNTASAVMAEQKPFANIDAQAIADAFRNRFLCAIADSERTHLAAAISIGGPGILKITALAMPFVAMAGMVGGPFGAMAASAIAGFRGMQACAKTVDRYFEAGDEVKIMLGAGGKTSLVATEEWLQRNQENLASLLDKLDRQEEDFRRASRLVQRIREAGDTKFLTEEDREFLRRQGYRKLSPPLLDPIRLPPMRCLTLGQQTGLGLAIWRDISVQAGPRASVARQMLGLAPR